MSHRIQRARVRYATARDQQASAYLEFPDRVVLFRQDNGYPLGIASDGYKVVQPAEVLEFFRDLTEAAGFHLDTAGTLFGGKKYWALARTNSEAVIIDKRDKVKAHLLLASSADGSIATEASYVATRVVCNNTLRMANGEHGNLKVKVNHRSRFRPEAVKAELGIEQAMSTFDRTIEKMRRMGQARLTEEATVLLSAGLINPAYGTLSPDDKAKVLKSKQVETIAKLALDGGLIGGGMDGMQGTAYGWLNAVTQYVDHDARTRGADTEAEKAANRFNSAYWGAGATTKERAFAIADSYSGSAVTSVNTWLNDNGGLLDNILNNHC